MASLATAGGQGRVEQSAAAEQPRPAELDSDVILDQNKVNEVLKE